MKTFSPQSFSVRPDELSDGSYVYDVVFGRDTDPAPVVVHNATSATEAEELAEALNDVLRPYQV